MATGTAQTPYILAHVLQELGQWADNILLKKELVRAPGPPALFGFQCYITLQILGKFYFCVILKTFFLLEFFSS